MELVLFVAALLSGFWLLGRLVIVTDMWYQRRRRRLEFAEPPAPATDGAILAEAGMIEAEPPPSLAPEQRPCFRGGALPGHCACADDDADQATRNVAHQQDFLRERRARHQPTVVERRRELVDPRDSDQVRR